MAQSTTNLGKIHVFPSETLYNQFKNLVADNDLVLLKDDGAYIVAANLAQNGYVKFSNGLILQWGVYTTGTQNVTITLPIATSVTYAVVAVVRTENNFGCSGSQNCQYVSYVTPTSFQAGSRDAYNGYAGFWWMSIGKA